MTPRAGECATCGFPGLRPEGHAEWCAGWECLSQAAKNEAAIAYAAANGVGEIGEAHRVKLRRARARIGR